MDLVLPQLSSHLTPLIAIGGYLAYPKELRINPSLLYFLSVAHNGLLVAFSAWSFVSLSQILYTEWTVFGAWEKIKKSPGIAYFLKDELETYIIHNEMQRTVTKNPKKPATK